ncbi:uncharacterized protein LOC144175602 [Haemaphysalis longicornis]
MGFVQLKYIDATHEVVSQGPGWSPALVAEVQLEILGKRSKQRTAPLWAAQLAWAIVRDDLKGHTLAYSGGSVRKRQGSASAGAVLGEVTRQALLQCAVSSATAELVGVSLDLTPALCPAMLLPGGPAAHPEGDLCSLVVHGVLYRGAWLRPQWEPQTQGAQGQRTSDVISAPNRAESSQPSCAPCGFQAEKHHLEVADSPACWPWRVARFNNREASCWPHGGIFGCWTSCCCCRAVPGSGTKSTRSWAPTRMPQESSPRFASQPG